MIIMHCYHEPFHILTIGNVKYYCADRCGVSEFKGDAVVNLSGLPNIPQLTNIPELAEHIRHKYEEIVVAWPDYGLPNVKSSFWKALHSYVVSKGWHDICLHCGEGHGRTGTAISALAISMLKWSVPYTIRFVRSNYCKKAVETQEQIQYLCALDRTLNHRKTKHSKIPKSSDAIDDTPPETKDPQENKTAFPIEFARFWTVNDENIERQKMDE